MLSSTVHALIHAHMLLLPALVPLIARRYGVSHLAVDGVGTVHYLAFGLGAIPAGLLADRVGSRAVLMWCLGGCAAAAATVALAPTFTVFAVGLIGLGAAASVYHPSGLSLISRMTPPEGLGRAIGLHGVGGNLGEALAPGVAALLAAVLGFRAPFALAGAAAVLLLIPVASLPRHAGAAVGSPRPGPCVRPPFPLSGPLVLVLCSALASGLVYRGSTYFLPRHLTALIDPASLSWLEGAARWLAAGRRGDALGAILTSMALLAGVLSQWWGGRLADRFRRERLLVVLACTVAPLILLLAVTRDTPLLLTTLAFGFAWYLGQPLGSSVAAELVPRERHGTLYGVLFSTSFGLGSLAVSAGGYLSARSGTRAAFLVLFVVALANVALAAVLASWLARRRRRAAAVS